MKEKYNEIGVAWMRSIMKALKYVWMYVCMIELYEWGINMNGRLIWM